MDCIFIIIACENITVFDLGLGKQNVSLQVYVAHFYMGKFGGDTPKRHRLWSNDTWLLSRIAEKAGYMSRDEQNQCKVKTTRKYIDAHGVKRCVGIKSVLRNSQ